MFLRISHQFSAPDMRFTRDVRLLSNLADVQLLERSSFQFSRGLFSLCDLNLVEYWSGFMMPIVLFIYYCLCSELYYVGFLLQPAACCIFTASGCVLGCRLI